MQNVSVRDEGVHSHGETANPSTNAPYEKANDVKHDEVGVRGMCYEEVLGQSGEDALEGRGCYVTVGGGAA